MLKYYRALVIVLALMCVMSRPGIAAKYNDEMIAAQQDITQGRKTKGEAAIRRIIEKCTNDINTDPKDTTAYAARGYSYMLLSEYNRALEDYGKVITLDPTTAMWYRNRAELYTKIGDYSKALKDINTAIDYYNGDPRAYVLRGEINAKLGYRSKAGEDYSKAAELEPGNANASFHAQRSFMFAQKGEYRKAWADLREAESRGYQFPTDYRDHVEGKKNLESMGQK